MVKQCFHYFYIKKTTSQNHKIIISLNLVIQNTTITIAVFVIVHSLIIIIKKY